MRAREKQTFLNRSCVSLFPLDNDLEVFQVISQLLNLGLVELFGRLEFLYDGQSGSSSEDAKIAYLFNQEASAYIHQYSIGICELSADVE
jgi:hypothetical protein